MAKLINKIQLAGAYPAQQQQQQEKTMTITHSDFQKNYTCDTYDGDAFSTTHYEFTYKAIAYEIDQRTILDNGVPMVIRVLFLQVSNGTLGSTEALYSTQGYLNGYDRNDAIKMVSQNNNNNGG